MCNGKAVRELIEWQFSPELEETRAEIAEFGITEKDILEDGVERRVRAHFPPKANAQAYKIFGFLRSNDSHVLVAGGMQHFVLGLDKSKLAPLAELYGLEFGSIAVFIQLYEREMLKKQTRTLADK